MLSQYDAMHKTLILTALNTFGITVDLEQGFLAFSLPNLASDLLAEWAQTCAKRQNCSKMRVVADIVSKGVQLCINRTCNKLI